MYTLHTETEEARMGVTSHPTTVAVPCYLPLLLPHGSDKISDIYKPKDRFILAQFVEVQFSRLVPRKGGKSEGQYRGEIGHGMVGGQEMASFFFFFLFCACYEIGATPHAGWLS